MQDQDNMRARIEPLIQERAPWLFSGQWHHDAARHALMGLLRYPRTLHLAEQYRDLPSSELMRRLAGRIAHDMRVSGLDNIPASGPALIVANHPTGIADGVILNHIISARRDDLFIYANHDILRVLPQMADLIAPVEWRLDKRSHAKTRATMDYTRLALAAGRIGLIFPSGRLAKREGLALQERPWMASAAMIARKFEVPVIPLHIRARNSALFYLLDAIHPTLRDVTLFNEVLNKAGQTFRVTVGAAIAPGTIPARSEDGIAFLRQRVLSLPEPGPEAVHLSQLRHLARHRAGAAHPA